MALEPQIQDDFTQRRLQRLELRYRRAQFVLAGAQAVYQSLREAPYPGARRLLQAQQRIEQAQEALVDIQSIIEYLEDRENAVQSASLTPPGAVPPAPADESNRASAARNSSHR
jgi:chromosome segregation ATPase